MDSVEHIKYWPILNGYLPAREALMAQRLFARSGLVALGLGLSAPALASSAQAWAELFARASKACIRASELSGAKAGQPADFQDKVLIMVDGRWPQPHMNNAPARFACLYDKRSRRAEARELPP